MRMLGSSTGALAALLAVQLAAPSFAAPKLVPTAVRSSSGPKVAVLVVGLEPLSSSRAAELEHAAELAVERSGRFQLAKLIDVLDPQNARARETRLKEATEAYAAGSRAYDELDTAKAAQLFDAAVKAFRDTDLTRTFGERTRAWVMKVASLVANGEPIAAKAQIDSIVALDPKAQFSSNYFPPELLKYVEDARRLATSGKQSLEVRTTPSGARVYVDGQYRGLSPVEVSNLASGEHHVALVMPGYSLAQQPVLPGPNEITLRPAEAHSRWKDAVDRIARDPEGALRDAAAKDFGKWAGVDQVLVVLAWSKGPKTEVTGLRIEVRDGHNAAFDEDILTGTGEPFVDSAASFVSRLLARDFPRKGGKPVVHYTEPGSGSGKRVAGYVLLGTSAALIGGGLFFGLQANGQAAQFKQTPQGTEQARVLERTGRTYALVADLSVLVGLLAAAPGGYLAFAGGGRTDEARPPESARREEKPPPREEKQKKRLDDEEDLRNF